MKREHIQGIVGNLMRLPHKEQVVECRWQRQTGPRLIKSFTTGVHFSYFKTRHIIKIMYVDIKKYRHLIPILLNQNL